jgi:hypothetical protein
VLLVDDEQPEPRHRGKDREARAEHQVGEAEVRGEPVAKPLRRRQPAVQRDDPMACKALDEAGLELRSQVDFGHEHEGLAMKRQCIGGGAQVDLGLAAACHAMEQQRGAGIANGLRADLFRGSAWSALSSGIRTRRLGPRQRACLFDLGAARRNLRIVEAAQLGRQHRQRDLADAALVVGRREVDQRRQLAASGGSARTTARIGRNSGSGSDAWPASSQTMPATSRRPSGTRTSVPGASGDSLA